MELPQGQMKSLHCFTNKFAKTLLPPDSLDVDAAYQDFCNTIKKAAKKTIPHGYRNNYIPCWDAECESLYKTFLHPQGGDSSLAAIALLAKLDRKRRNPRLFGALTSHTLVEKHGQNRSVGNCLVIDLTILT